MGSHLKMEEKLVRFLYIGDPEGIYITGNPEPHLSYVNKCRMLIIFWNKPEETVTVKEFLKTIEKVNESKYLIRRENIFFLLAHAMELDLFKAEEKLEIRDSILNFVKSDKEFFDFIKYYTCLRAENNKGQKISTSLKKIIIKFYQSKSPKELYECVTKQESYHGWTHRDLIKLCHYKTTNISTVPIIKYVLFGIKQLPDPDNPDDKVIVENLKKCYELRTTEDVSRAAALISELHASLDRVNSKLNKQEEVWCAALDELTTRQILRHLYKFYKMGFLKPNTQMQAKIIEAVTNAESIKKCGLHPVEVFIFLKCFERGGKALDPKLIEYLSNKKEIKEEIRKKLTTPIEPKCQIIVQNVNKCLMLSYNNLKPFGKKIMITVDPLEKTDSFCCHNKRISCLEAAYAMIRYLMKIEKNVTVAVFKDNQITFVDLSKSYSSQKAIEKLRENQPTYVLPGAPLEWAASKKRHFDVFINFLRSGYQADIPKEVKEKMDTPEKSLHTYCKKMKSPDTKLVRFFLSSVNGVYSDATKNILTIAGFSGDVPKVLEAFIKGCFY